MEHRQAFYFHLPGEDSVVPGTDTFIPRRRPRNHPSPVDSRRHCQVLLWPSSEAASLTVSEIILSLPNSFFFFNFFENLFFIWRMIAWRYHVAFCGTTRWISCKYTNIPSLLDLPPTTFPPYHPSRSSESSKLSSPCYKQLPTSSVPHIVVPVCQCYPPFPPLCP